MVGDGAGEVERRGSLKGLLKQLKGEEGEGGDREKSDEKQEKDKGCDSVGKCVNNEANSPPIEECEKTSPKSKNCSAVSSADHQNSDENTTQDFNIKTDRAVSLTSKVDREEICEDIVPEKESAPRQKELSESKKEEDRDTTKEMSEKLVENVPEDSKGEDVATEKNLPESPDKLKNGVTKIEEKEIDKVEGANTHREKPDKLVKDESEDIKEADVEALQDGAIDQEVENNKKDTDIPEAIADKIVNNVPYENDQKDVKARHQDIPIKPVAVVHVVGDEGVIVGENMDHGEEGEVDDPSAKKDEGKYVEEKGSEEMSFIKGENIKKEENKPINGEDFRSDGDTEDESICKAEFEVSTEPPFSFSDFARQPNRPDSPNMSEGSEVEENNEEKDERGCLENQTEQKKPAAATKVSLGQKICLTVRFKNRRGCGNRLSPDTVWSYFVF